MKMSHKIGFTLDEAEVLRRIVGKKKVEEVKKWKEKISDKIKQNNLAPEIGDILWRILENSANYSFNKSHSMSYAALAACTIYLKLNRQLQMPLQGGHHQGGFVVRIDLIDLYAGPGNQGFGDH